MTRVALAHDYLTQRGGAERVVAVFLRAFPEAPVHTTVYEAPRTFDAFEDATIHTTPLQRLGPLRRNPRLALPVLPIVVGRHRVDAEVTLCSTSGWAHGFPTTGHKVLYVHNTPRWLYQQDEYLAHLPRSYALGLAPLTRPLHRWDVRAAASADVLIANSLGTRERIRTHWRRDAEILHPPPGLSSAGPSRPIPGVEPGFLLCVNRLLPYKRVDIVLDAVAQGDSPPLVIVGDGPDRQRLETRASRRTRFVTSVDDAELRWLYTHASALVTASQEDLGLTPLEAMTFGTPVVAIAAGGFLETVEPDVSGIFFDAPDARSLRSALDRARTHEWDREALRTRAEGFSEASFIERIRAVVHGIGHSQPITEGSNR